MELVRRSARVTGRWWHWSAAGQQPVSSRSPCGFTVWRARVKRRKVVWTHRWADRGGFTRSINVSFDLKEKRGQCNATLLMGPTAARESDRELHGGRNKDVIFRNHTRWKFCGKCYLRTLQPLTPLMRWNVSCVVIRTQDWSLAAAVWN